MMKRIFISALLFACLMPLFGQVADVTSGATSIQETKAWNPMIQREFNNDNFDNSPLKPLTLTVPLINGEVSNPSYAQFENCLLRSVVIKEVVEDAGKEGLVFNGVFRYQGYPLADILKDIVVDKKNKAEFPVEIDLFVQVSNDQGESAVFSWGEIFYSKRGRDIIFATGVTPIYPTKTDDTWPVPESCSLISGCDLHTLRNIKNPTTITIRSFPRSFPGEKGAEPLYVPNLKITQGSKKVKIDAIPAGIHSIDFPTVFYGLHRGFKEVKTFKGYSFADVLNSEFEFSSYDLQHGLIAVGAIDAFRVVYSLSEILNRADLESVLFIDLGKDDNGRFKIFPSADVFADRQLKGAAIGHILNIE